MYFDAAVVFVTKHSLLFNLVLAKEFCNRGRVLSAAETASHSSITNFLSSGYTMKSRGRFSQKELLPPSHCLLFTYNILLGIYNFEQSAKHFYAASISCTAVTCTQYAKELSKLCGII